MLLFTNLFVYSYSVDRHVLLWNENDGIDLTFIDIPPWRNNSSQETDTQLFSFLNGFKAYEYSVASKYILFQVFLLKEDCVVLQLDFFKFLYFFFQSRYIQGGVRSFEIFQFNFKLIDIIIHLNGLLLQEISLHGVILLN